MNDLQLSREQLCWAGIAARLITITQELPLIKWDLVSEDWGQVERRAQYIIQTMEQVKTSAHNRRQQQPAKTGEAQEQPHEDVGGSSSGE